jgi:hypothetical protein
MIQLVRWVPVVIGVFAFFSFVALIRILRKTTCILGHRQKRFLTMDFNGAKNAQGIFIPRCRCFTVQGEATDYHRFLMRWFCDACNSMGEHCWEKTGSWKLEHGKIVPDEKRWANRA